MRALIEIIDGAKDGVRPTEDESYHAMLVLDFLLAMANMDLRKVADDATRPQFRELFMVEAHERLRRALRADPVVYMGDNVPGNPGHDAFRSMAKKVLARVEAQARREETGDGD